MNGSDITVFNLLEEKMSLKYFTCKGGMEEKDMLNCEMKHGQYDTTADL